MERIKEISNMMVAPREWPEFGAGDTVTITVKITEGKKERLQAFQGVVIQRRGSGMTETFTVRKMSSSIGVERIFPTNSPHLESIVVNKYGVVRRSRIFYIRNLTGKSARIKERRI
jgi:large subunit ribosomal protein L19|tara:strand:- start:73 stop:420 length:348 start_codon:yes stop_codon:yes gene_type:complete